MDLINSTEVQAALSEGRPVVALESTIIAHGLPRPSNLHVAREVESIVREEGAVPATIAILDGRVHIGLSDRQLIELSERDDITKASTRDLPMLIASKKSAATTVASTSYLAWKAGISTFATGGLGGVHRGAATSFDESADLTQLAQTPITVVCAGVKSILDIAATLERLETLGISLVGYQTDRFPGFYLQDSGYPLEYRLESGEAIADVMCSRTHAAALIVAQPVSEPMDRKLHDDLLEKGLAAAEIQGVVGKGVTPFLLEYFHRNSNGESLRVNTLIIKENARLAARIAVSYSKMSN
ncbi:MAG: pseudouridine-5'-phosphate glycosidase [Candidatus Nanopelagicaceae bacterium]|jgi:pseudouridine-5'-phosphate glycosidase